MDDDHLQQPQQHRKIAGRHTSTLWEFLDKTLIPNFVYPVHFVIVTSLSSTTRSLSD